MPRVNISCISKTPTPKYDSEDVWIFFQIAKLIPMSSQDSVLISWPSHAPITMLIKIVFSSILKKSKTTYLGHSSLMKMLPNVIL